MAYIVLGNGDKRSGYIWQTFTSVELAVRAIADHGGAATYKVVNEHDKLNFLWRGERGDARKAITTHTEGEFMSSTLSNGTIDPNLVLGFKRTDLIGALQVKLDAENAAAQKVIDDRAAALKDFSDAVAQLTPEQVVGAIREYVTKDVASIEKWIKDGKYTDAATTPQAQETALGRAVRILTLSNDETVELSPTDNIYKLL